MAIPAKRRSTKHTMTRLHALNATSHHADRIKDMPIATATTVYPIARSHHQSSRNDLIVHPSKARSPCDRRGGFLISYSKRPVFQFSRRVPAGDMQSRLFVRRRRAIVSKRKQCTAAFVPGKVPAHSAGSRCRFVVCAFHRSPFKSTLTVWPDFGIRSGLSCLGVAPGPPHTVSVDHY